MGKIANSITDLLYGIGKVHHDIVENIPGAAKIPPATRRKINESTSPADILEERNRLGLLGIAPGGKKAVGTFRDTYGRAGDMSRFEKAGDLPEDFKLDVGDGTPGSRFGSFNIYKNIDDPSDYPAGIAQREEILRLRGMPQVPPDLMHINATAAPRSGGMGQAGYQLIYDLMRPTGNVTASGTLTEINSLRRPMNVMNYGLGQGTYKGVVPVPEEGYPTFADVLAYDPRAMARLRSMFEGSGVNDIENQLRGLTSKDVAEMSTEEITGLLSVIEAVAARRHGPDTYGMMFDPTLKIGRPAPADTDLFNAMAEIERPQILKMFGPDSKQAAIGPKTLGRAATTEEALLRLLRGQDVDRIVGEITGGGALGDRFKGRYAKGGLAAALT